MGEDYIRCTMIHVGYAAEKNLKTTDDLQVDEVDQGDHHCAAERRPMEASWNNLILPRDQGPDRSY